MSSADRFVLGLVGMAVYFREGAPGNFRGGRGCPVGCGPVVDGEKAHVGDEHVREVA